MYGNDVWEYYNIKTSDNIFQTKGIVFANDVDWNGTNYILKEDVLYKSVGDYQIDKNLIANSNHYTCFSNDNTCDKIYYIYLVTDQYISYIELENGVKIEDAFDKMNENDQDSKIKETLEKWFSNSNLINEENFSLLEDAIYCADRSRSDEIISGWDKDGNAFSFLYYSSYYRRINGIPNLDCGNKDDNRDRFTYRDSKTGNGLLKYPVGLLTADEAVLAGANLTDANFDFYLNSGSSYWIMSAGNMNYNAYASFIKDNGLIDYDYTFRSFGVRPVITLASFVEFDRDSDGTFEKPYVVSLQKVN